LFSNRLIPQTRSDYEQNLRWLGLEPQAGPMAILLRGGGQRATDTLQIFPLPEPTSDGKYVLYFFAHGLRHIPGAVEAASKLSVGAELRIESEPSNPADALALKLLDGLVCVGYCPRFFTEDLHKLRELGATPRAFVARVNDESAPIQWRLLCKVVAEWRSGFQPLTGRQFQPITSKQPRTA